MGRVDAPDLTLRYDEHADGLVDLHLPSTAGPSVLLLHGGFWKQEYDRTYLYPMARALSELGYVVATPEYRRTGGGGGWPATCRDVDSVTAALPGLCADLDVAWERPVAVGHSAGGHLALLLAGSKRPLAGVVGLGPVCDLRGALDLGLGSGAAAAFLDGTDPSAADPMDHPAPAGLRVELVHGLHDEDVPIALSRTYARAHPSTVLTKLDCGHFEPITPGSIAWPAVVRAVASAARSG